MINILFGGLIGLVSGVVIGILTPSINNRIQEKKEAKRQLLTLTASLYLLRNTILNYLHLQIDVNQLGEFEAGKDMMDRLKRLSQQIDENLDSILRIQMETISKFKKESIEVRKIFDLLNDLRDFIFSQKHCYNEDKLIYDQETADNYTVNLNNSLNKSFKHKIDELVEINKKMLKRTVFSID